MSFPLPSAQFSCMQTFFRVFRTFVDIQQGNPPPSICPHPQVYASSEMFFSGSNQCEMALCAVFCTAVSFGLYGEIPLREMHVHAQIFSLYECGLISSCRSSNSSRCTVFCLKKHPAHSDGKNHNSSSCCRIFTVFHRTQVRDERRRTQKQGQCLLYREEVS
jgi:hypothetical protein